VRYLASKIKFSKNSFKNSSYVADFRAMLPKLDILGREKTSAFGLNSLAKSILLEIKGVIYDFQKITLWYVKFY
jgi:hypothetical protein